MLKTMLALFLSVGSLRACTQDISWDKTTNWRIYAIQNTKAMDTPEDSLNNVRSVAIPQSAIIPFLTSSSLLKGKENPAWNGIYLVSYELPEGKIHKLYVSSNGSFFLDKSSGNYYEIREVERDRWRELIVQHLKNVKRT